jgi:hypothetical protein
MTKENPNFLCLKKSGLCEILGVVANIQHYRRCGI